MLLQEHKAALGSRRARCEQKSSSRLLELTYSRKLTMAGDASVDELRSVVGEGPSNDLLNALLARCSGDVTRAANAFFDVSTDVDEAGASAEATATATRAARPSPVPQSSVHKPASNFLRTCLDHTAAGQG